MTARCNVCSSRGSCQYFCNSCDWDICSSCYNSEHPASTRIVGEFYSGEITVVNTQFTPDGIYTVKYEDGSKNHSVSRDRIIAVHIPDAKVNTSNLMVLAARSMNTGKIKVLLDNGYRVSDQEFADICNSLLGLVFVQNAPSATTTSVTAAHPPPPQQMQMPGHLRPRFHNAPQHQQQGLHVGHVEVNVDAGKPAPAVDSIVTILNLLLHPDINCNVRGSVNETALATALSVKNLDVVRFLLDHGAVPDTENHRIIDIWYN